LNAEIPSIAHGLSMKTPRESDIPQTLRKMPTEDVAAWCESFVEGSANRILGQLELQRRRDHAMRVRIWIAMGLATCALVLSLIALYASTMAR
jgi:hypothetical protein